jgi:branched-chain amino acid transport system substrate-binding protein
MCRSTRFLSFGALAALAISCAPRELIVGFIGGLSGQGSEQAVGARNGARIAVEEANAAGGVAGFSIRLQPEDDLMTPEGAVAAFERLKAAGAKAIVGPMWSSMSLAVLPLANDAGIPLVSPTASSKALTGIDDMFLRVNPPDVSESRDLARFAIAAGHKAIVAAYDVRSNRSFAEGLAKDFQAAYASGGGEGEVALVEYTSGEDPSRLSVASRILAFRPDAVLVIAEVDDTAFLAQQLRLAGSKAALYGTGWALDEAIIEKGGSAVEGMAFSHYYFPGSRDPGWLAFSRRYEERYGEAPDFAAGLGYDAMRAILAALGRSGDPSRIKESIIAIGSFPSFQGGELRIDAFGDAELSRHRIEARGGRLVAVAE